MNHAPRANYLIQILASAMLIAFGYELLISPRAQAEPLPPVYLVVTATAPTVAPTSTPAQDAAAPNRAPLDAGPKEDYTTWQDWPDVDHSARVEVLHCSNVHERYDQRDVGYDMSSATHTEIWVWFSLGHDGQLAYMDSCG